MAHVATITIDHTKVPGDLTDYVGLIVPDGSAGYAALYALCLEGGGDIRLFKSDDTTELAREIVTFSVTDETGEIHYKYSGTLSSSVDTDIHVYADGSSADYATTDTYGSEAVWGDYFAVWHMNRNGSTITDVSGNGWDLTLGGSPTAGADGSSEDFSPAGGDDRWSNQDIPNEIGTQDYSTTIFAKVDSLESSIDQRLIGMADADFSDGTMQIEAHRSNDMYVWCGVRVGGGNWTTDGENKFALWAIQRDGNNLRGRINGTELVSTSSASVGSESCTGELVIGNWAFANIGYARGIAGNIGEVRISTLVLSEDWEETEYNNQNSYSTFYSVAAVGGGSTSAQAARRGAVMMM